MLKKLTLLAVLVLLPALAMPQTAGDVTTSQRLIAQLRQFLVDAAQGNPAGFDSFFADDVIYTRSAGVVTNKAEILKNVSSMRPTAESKTTYSAEEITVHDYGDTAIVAFQLVARTEHADGKITTANYRNTGTFLRRGARWQVVAWQSTKIPEAAVAK
ncbi:MAG TPA: nuclear transport factor 2 family protein [Candidatus Acidoferrales bacterium]|nr:nuclear transport factor 2 family protein [Candidatus Acidoferrales bacterium]